MMNRLDPVRAALDAAPSPVTLFFRDDDIGWRNDRLRALLDVFAEHGLPLDLAVIPAALDPVLAEELKTHDGRIGLHQHGFAHLNHETNGRKFEFGPSRPPELQRRDIAAGAQRLAQLLGDRVETIFTPPWNRCTADTGRCLVDLGFRALSREAKAEPLGVPGLCEVPIHVDWCKPDREERLARALINGGPTGVMFHHAEMDAAERERAGELLSLVACHPSARPHAMAELLA
jgi:peptidoglycan/xylan/chitin deacetylase (PgdA/CDA1 family)